MLVRYTDSEHRDHVLTTCLTVLSMEDLSKTPFLILGNKIDRKLYRHLTLLEHAINLMQTPVPSARINSYVLCDC
jgi:GTPase SAR1 family protein